MLTAADRIELAQLLYPHVTKTREELEQEYPARDLPAGAMVTRFAPSPTGYVHIGGIYASLISKSIAEQSGGVFYLRIEDTDQRREVSGGVEGIITTMQAYGVPPSEGYVDVGVQKGAYGPYIQSQRKDIYDVFAKWLVEAGHAYPCFCSEEELAAIHDQQVKIGLMKKGYYGKWAKHRDLSLVEVKDQLNTGAGFVLRVRAPEVPGKARFTDLVRGNVEVEGNSYDMVLIKSNGLPTYHYAHVIDDHLMRTTHVTRGEEWLSTAPLHVQLFEMFGFALPTYIHFSHIGKMEGGSVRKLSKRKDPEAAMSLYTEQGYPPVAVLEYLLNLANSGFSDWRRANPTKPHTEFTVNPAKIGKNIALFDLVKLEDISRDVVARMTEQDLFQAVLNWAQAYQPAFAELMMAKKSYFLSILSIERHQERPRKDIVKWSQLPEIVWYFFDDQFAQRRQFALSSEVDTETAHQALQFFIDAYDPDLSKDAWTEQSRALAERLGYARDIKSYKQQPDQYKGHIGHVMSVLRVALTSLTNTPDLYQVMQVMGKDRVIDRLRSAQALLS